MHSKRERMDLDCRLDRLTNIEVTLMYSENILKTEASTMRLRRNQIQQIVTEQIKDLFESPKNNLNIEMLEHFHVSESLIPMPSPSSGPGDALTTDQGDHQLVNHSALIDTFRDTKQLLKYIPVSAASQKLGYSQTSAPSISLVFLVQPFEDEIIKKEFRIHDQLKGAYVSSLSSRGSGIHVTTLNPPTNNVGKTQLEVQKFFSNVLRQELDIKSTMEMSFKYKVPIKDARPAGDR